MNLNDYFNECRRECRQEVGIFEQLKYTKPHIYIPPSLRDKHGSYKPKPGENIRVTWSHYHPKKQKRVEVKRSLGIRNFETLAEQKKFAKGLCKAYELRLKRGYDPFDIEDTETDNSTLLKDLKTSLNNKEGKIAASTFRDYSQNFQKFETWLKSTNDVLIKSSSTDLGKLIDRFFNDLLKEKINPTSYNNQRAGLSALFADLVKRRLLIANPITTIDKLKADPKKNKAFTAEQLKDNSKWMQENDPALHFYIKVIGYSFLRNNEVMRLKIGDIDLKRRVIKIKTKSQKSELIPIIEQLYQLFMEEKIYNYPSDYNLIHHEGAPELWNATLNHKLRLFGKRFMKLKKAIGYNEDYTVYSYRHSVALLVFKSFENENLTTDEVLLKMKAVTRHKSVAGLKNYLRGIGAYVAKDYSKRINIDL